MLDRLVAIKQMAPHLLDDPIACGEFRREAQCLARIGPEARHLVGILELIEDNHGLFIVQEHVEGRTLESWISKRLLDADKALRILGTAALGLKSLHSLGLVHRNLNPGGIMVVDGIGCRLADLSSVALEGDGSLPPVIAHKYAAPELLAGRDFDDRVDIYSLGIIFFEMCVGRPAVDRHFADIIRDSAAAADHWRAWHLDATARLPDPMQLNPSIPRAIADIIVRMTAKDLVERYRSIDEVIAGLTAYFRARRRDAERRLEGPAPVRLIGNLAPASQSRRLIDTRPETRTATALSAGGTAAQRVGRTASEPDAPMVSTRRIVALDLHDRAAPREASREPAYLAPGTKSIGARRRRALPAPPKPVVASAPVPLPTPAHETYRNLRLRRILMAACFAVLLVGGFSVVAAWTRMFGLDDREPARAVLAQGRALFRNGDLAAARDRFREAQRLAGQKSTNRWLMEEAVGWTALSEAELALDRDELSIAERWLETAEGAGLEPLAVQDLRGRLSARQALQTFALDLESMLALGDFEGLDQLEQRLRRFEESRRGSEMDTTELKERLVKSRTRRKFDETIRAARGALERNDFAQAQVSCAEARRIEDGDEVTKLELKIAEMKSRYEWVLRGNAALYEEDYKEAVEAFERANRIKPSKEIEEKSKLARAHVLLAEAREAIEAGDLIEGEHKLRSAIWNHPLAEAVNTLDKMAPSFEAGRWVQQGDRARAAGNAVEARAMYERALPRLTGRAADRVRDRLRELATSQPEAP